jgi:tRNA threonylcarbamoyladenosine biosynthesis protein TsaB
MLLFGLDTATLTLSAALVQRERGVDRLLARADVPPPTHHSDLLPALIAQLLAEAGAGLGDLAAFVIGLGPGSFTGLRIGLATAKGLCYAARVPLLGASSLTAMALAAAPDADEGELLVPCLDARKSEVYCGLFRRCGDSVEPPHQGTAGGAAFGRPIRLESPTQGTARGAAFGRPIRLESPTQGTARGAAFGRPIRLESPTQGTAGGAAFGRPIRLESPTQGTAGGAAFGRPIRLEREGGEMAIGPEALLARLAGARAQVFGIGREAYPPLAALPPPATRVRTPDAFSLVRSVGEVPPYEPGKVFSLEPHYVRPSDSEWTLKAKKKG